MTELIVKNPSLISRYALTCEVYGKTEDKDAVMAWGITKLMQIYMQNKQSAW
jgi:hypothetical protein